MRRWRFVVLPLALVACSDRPFTETTADPSTSTSGMNVESTSGVPTTGDTTSTTEGSGPGTTSTSSTTTGEPEGSTLDEQCLDRVPFEIDFIRPDVMLVIDKSGSMANILWDHDGDDANDDGLQDADDVSPATPRQTRWRSTIEVLTEFLGARDGALNTGAVLFPSMDATQIYGESACVTSPSVEVPVADANASQILETLPPANASNLHGASPMRRGIEAAVAELAGIEDDAVRRIVVVTDGAANCAAEAQDDVALLETYDALLEPVVADAHAQGFSTHVIGIEIADVTSGQEMDGSPDNTNTYERLSALAVAGGVAREGADKFYNVKNDAEMMAALTEIADGLIPCTLSFGVPAFFPDRVEVTVDGVEYGRVQDTCAGEDGWRWLDGTFQGIELCGQACLDFKRTGDIEVRQSCASA